MQSRRLVVLVLATMCWGSAASASKYALRGFGPLTLLVVELSVAVVLLWVVLLIRNSRHSLHSIRPSSRYALLGLFEPGLAYAGLNFGLVYTSAVNGSLLGGLETPMVVLLAVFVLRERLHRRGVIAVGITFIGVALVSVAHTTPRAGLGVLLIIGSVISAAIYVLLTSRQPAGTVPIVMTAWQFTFGLAYTLPFLTWQWATGAEAIPLHTELSAWFAAVIAGGVGFAASFLLYNSVATTLPATVSGMALSLIPLFGLLTALLTLHEPVTITQIIGGILIVLGVRFFPKEDEHALAIAPISGTNPLRHQSVPEPSNPDRLWAAAPDVQANEFNPRN
jgi:drug/metabolite transporter (DMT)-like permease